MRAAFVRAALAPLAALAFHAAQAVPPTVEEIDALCKDADGAVHCGRRIEEMQLKRLPNLARRDGDVLIVSLYPTGTQKFEDTTTLAGGKAYALFDYVNEINAAVLWVVTDDQLGFLLLQRATGRQTPMPAQPILSPDRQRFATADFCADKCDNEVAVWRVSRDGVAKDLVFRPRETWTDAVVRWKDAGTLVVEYTPAGGTPRTVERKLAEPGWSAPGR